MDKNNKVAGLKDPYAIRLTKLFKNHTNELMSSHPDGGKRARSVRDKAKKDGV